jgi:hypothetical protein
VDERGFSLKYAKNQLKKWSLAPVVPEQVGLRFYFSKPIITGRSSGRVSKPR